MADLPREPDSNTGNGNPPDMPRWVKVFGIVVGVLALLFVIVHLTGHGIGGHMS